MLSLLLLFFGSKAQFMNIYWEIFASVVIYFGLLGTPILAFIYYLICIGDYHKVTVKTQNHENTQ